MDEEVDRALTSMHYGNVNVRRGRLLTQCIVEQHGILAEGLYRLNALDVLGNRRSCGIRVHDNCIEFV